jgi:hypothetical protein
LEVRVEVVLGDVDDVIEFLGFLSYYFLYLAKVDLSTA